MSLDSILPRSDRCAVLIFVVPLLLAGCTYALPSPCDEAACAPYACVDGACEVSCDSYGIVGDAIPCATGYVCADNGACELECDDADCADHLRCDESTNSCLTYCSTDSDCVSGFECCGPGDDCNDSRWDECVRP